jgi:nucleotide-binding universal stress UspA family protein
VNILLAIDRSTASNKAVGFVADVFGGAGRGDLKITLLHVAESPPDELLFVTGDPAKQAQYRKLAEELEQASRAEGERLLVEKQQALVATGLPPAAVGTKLIVRDSRPEARKVVAALAIIDEMQQGVYDVVCLGRRGTGAGGAAMSSFPGSVAEKVLRSAQGRTVWVVD